MKVGRSNIYNEQKEFREIGKKEKIKKISILFDRIHIRNSGIELFTSA